MEHKVIEFRIYVPSFQLSRRVLKWGLVCGFLLFLTASTSTESVTLTTYYPAPAGAYNNMVTIGNTWLARDPQTSGAQSFVEIGTNEGVPNPNTKLIVTGYNGNDSQLVAFGTNDPSLGGTVGSGFTINTNQPTSFAIGQNGAPAFALNASPGGWQMFDHAAGGWTQGLSEAYGNVGIQTGSPSQRLDVENSSTWNGVWVRNSGNGSGLDLFDDGNPHVESGGAGGPIWINGDNGNDVYLVQGGGYVHMNCEWVGFDYLGTGWTGCPNGNQRVIAQNYTWGWWGFGTGSLLPGSNLNGFGRNMAGSMLCCNIQP